MKEVEVAWEILKALGLRERGPVMIACPSCGRDDVGVWEPRGRRSRIAARGVPAGVRGRGDGLRGELDRERQATPTSGSREAGTSASSTRTAACCSKVTSETLIDELFVEIDRWLEAGMQRPKRLKMAKPAALAMAEASLIPLD